MEPLRELLACTRQVLPQPACTHLASLHDLTLGYMLPTIPFSICDFITVLLPTVQVLNAASATQHAIVIDMSKL